LCAAGLANNLLLPPDAGAGGGSVAGWDVALGVAGEGAEPAGGAQPPQTTPAMRMRETIETDIFLVTKQSPSRR
jgi:hypothetical protein